MRFEKKFIIQQDFNNILRHFLYDNNFKKHYSQRVVNSIYYDSNCFRRFSESEDGISDRSKCRIRFYNNDTEKLCLEYKSKISEVGWKITNYINYKNKNYLFKNIVIKNSSNERLEVSIPIKIKDIDFPSLFVSYLRHYYISDNGQIRLTIDSNLVFGKMRIGNIIIKNIKNIDCNMGVLEFKYGSEIKDLKIIDKILSKYTLNISSFSKYCLGIKYCY